MSTDQRLVFTEHRLIRAARWNLYTGVRPRKHIWLQVDEYTDEEGDADPVEVFSYALSCGDLRVRYRLTCSVCGQSRAFEGTADDAMEDDQFFRLGGLDERIEPWVREHDACPWQMRLPL